ncbi:MAG: hypothetical protein BGO07_02580 [Alphaproteobacteria bacterium 40-19]|nr:MAG: hypothetical protein BGO07_02580 [Alphaproteobacteria bacterium 40-19]
MLLKYTVRVGIKFNEKNISPVSLLEHFQVSSDVHQKSEFSFEFIVARTSPLTIMMGVIKEFYPFRLINNVRKFYSNTEASINEMYHNKLNFLRTFYQKLKLFRAY